MNTFLENAEAKDPVKRTVKVSCESCPMHREYCNDCFFFRGMYQDNNLKVMCGCEEYEEYDAIFKTKSGVIEINNCLVKAHLVSFLKSYAVPLVMPRFEGGKIVQEYRFCGPNNEQSEGTIIMEHNDEAMTLRQLILNGENDLQIELNNEQKTFFAYVLVTGLYTNEDEKKIIMHVHIKFYDEINKN